MIHELADVQSKKIGIGTIVWQYAVILKDAEIGSECNINCHTFIENDVVIGNKVTIKPGVYIWDGITIEDEVLVGPNVTFTNDKWPKSKNVDFKLLRTLIKKGASIGAGSTILGGITIGKNSLIAAGALVTKNVPERALMAGFPAKCVGFMNEDGTPMTLKNGFYEDCRGDLWKNIDNELIKL